MTASHDWPFEQPARGTLRPWYLTAAGYLAVLFPDGQEAQRAKQGLLQRGVLANDVRLYDAEEPLVQPAPAGGRRAAAQLLGWQQRPRGGGAGHEQRPP
jgi:hypothetical protein